MHQDEVDDDGHLHLLDHEGGVLQRVADTHNVDTLPSTHASCTTAVTSFWRFDGACVKKAVKEKHGPWITTRDIMAPNTKIIHGQYQARH
jgi:hypothetical protein